jgi:hypothetical protein
MIAIGASALHLRISADHVLHLVRLGCDHARFPLKAVNDFNFTNSRVTRYSDSFIARSHEETILERSIHAETGYGRVGDVSSCDHALQLLTASTVD